MRSAAIPTLALGLVSLLIGVCETPILLMMGRDIYHPESISRRFAELAPCVTFVEDWKEAQHLETTDRTIKDFLSRQSNRAS